MLNQHRRRVRLSFLSFDLPVWSITEAAATVYQQEAEQYHVLLTEPVVQEHFPTRKAGNLKTRPRSPRLLWVELSPYRVSMTMQGNGRFSYRHFWEPGVYGINRYWLQCGNHDIEQMQLQNYTLSLSLTGEQIPEQLRLEYELWTHDLRMGRYVMTLDIHSA